MTEIREERSHLTADATRRALHDEYVATMDGTATDPKRLGMLFRSVEADDKSKRMPEDSESQGEVLKNFLHGLHAMHGADLTHEQVHADRQLPFLNDQEKKMMEFTDNNFDKITRLHRDEDKKTISWTDMEQVKNYPHATMIDKAFLPDFREKAAWAGAAVGAVGELAAYVYATPAAMMVSSYGGMAVGGLAFLKSGNIFDAATASAVASVAWGPFLGGLAGYGIGHALAEPTWGMFEGRRINNFYKQMKTSIPTYSQFSGRAYPVES